MILVPMARAQFAWSDGNRAVVEAAMAGDARGVAVALSRGASPDAADENGAPALMWAAMSGSLETVRTLVAAGADARRKGIIWEDQTRTGYYGSVLAAAAAGGHVEMLAYLIEKARLPVDDREWNPQTGTESGWTPLEWAAARGREAAVRYLLRQRANPDIRSADGHSALLLALQSGHEPVALLLIEAGADTRLAGPDGMTPLHHAVLADMDVVVSLLLQKGAEIDAREPTLGLTPLMLAAGEGKGRLAQRLVGAGASLTLRNARGQTARELARAMGHDLELSASEIVGRRRAGEPVARGADSARPRLVSQLGHADALNSVGFSPDDRLALTGSLDGSLRLWHLETGREIRTFRQASAMGAGNVGLFGGVFSPSGREIAAGDLEGAVHLWDIATGQLVRTFRGHQDLVGALAFSPDGRHLLTGSADGRAALWDVARGDAVQTFAAGFSPDKFVGFSADGRLVVAAGGAFAGAQATHDALVVWTREGREMFRLAQHGVMFQGVAVSPVAPLLAVATFDGRVLFFSLETGRAAGAIRDPGVNAVSFLPDGRHVVTTDGREATLWSLASGEAVRRMEAGGHGAVAVAASHDGRYAMTGGTDRTARIWSLETGDELRRLEGRGSGIGALAFSADGRTLYSAARFHSIVAWSLETGKAAGVFRGSGEEGKVALSRDGRHAAFAGRGSATLVSLETGRPVRRVSGPFEPQTPIGFSPDGTLLTAVDHGALSPQGQYAPRLRRWAVDSGEELGAERLREGTFTAVAQSPDGRHAVMAYVTMNMAGLGAGGMFGLDLGRGGFGFESKLVLLDVRSGRPFELPGEFTESVAFSADGGLLATGHLDGVVRVWSVGEKREILRFEGHPDAVEALAFSPDAALLATGSADLTRIWDLEQRREVARLASPAPEEWTVVELGGRFDAHDLERIEGLHWVMPDDPLQPMPVEIFMRDYYEPRLLPRLLAGEELPALRDLSEINRVQPRVEITGVEAASGRPGYVAVSVEVESQRRVFFRDGREAPLASGVYDLRLFRDGRLVEQWPAPPDQPSGQVDIATSAALEGWRRAARVEEDAGGRATRRFLVRVPRQAGVDRVEFSAYAFNADRVKSATARRTCQIPGTSAPARGRAHVISIGVTTTQDPYWSLDFAGADARLMRDRFTDALRRSGGFSEVTAVTLVNQALGPFAAPGEEDAVQPTKANIRAVFDLLAGRSAGEAGATLPASLRGRVGRAAPEDLVIISMAAHGLRDARGMFYLLPYDVGSGSGGQLTDELKRRAISSEELSLWLGGVDAQMALILGTCYSAAAVEAGGFKPGPLGDRGLGQLSYDKAMPVLVASQSSSWEVGGHGLLAHALAIEGLAMGNAGQSDGRLSLASVLAYARDRVPALHAERIGQGESAQQPTLFDFRPRKRDIMLAVVR